MLVSYKNYFWLSPQSYKEGIIVSISHLNEVREVRDLPLPKHEMEQRCHLSINCVTLLPHCKTSKIPMIYECDSTLTFVPLDVATNMKVFYFYVTCFILPTWRSNNLLGIGIWSLFIKNLFFNIQHHSGQLKKKTKMSWTDTFAIPFLTSIYKLLLKMVKMLVLPQIKCVLLWLWLHVAV